MKELIPDLQVIFFEWFKHHNIRSEAQIRSACNNLLENNELDNIHSLYKLFYPLVRKGLIEFVGKNKYQVSSSVILLNKKFKVAIGVNLSVQQKENLKLSSDLEEDKFGIVRFNYDLKNIKQFSEKYNCDYKVIYSSKILNKFPKAIDILSTLETASITSTNIQFYYARYRTWKNRDNQINGLFRLSEDSLKKYLRLDGKNYSIPSSTTNPEIRFIAETYQITNELNDSFKYSKMKKELIISYVNLPILIDRLLRMPSIHDINGITEDKKSTTYNHIEFATVKQLQRIFSIKIKLIDE